jgi:hypothetical protein
MVHTPDVWVVVKITNHDDVMEKVLAGWYGGYMGSDSWQLSSQIDHTAEFKDRYEFKNRSGSLYICYKNRRRMSNHTGSIYTGFEQDIQALGDPDIRIEIVGIIK